MQNPHVKVMKSSSGFTQPSVVLELTETERSGIEWFLRRSTVYWNLLHAETNDIIRSFAMPPRKGCRPLNISQSAFFEAFMREVMALEEKIEATEAKFNPGESEDDARMKARLIQAKELPKDIRIQRAVDMLNSVLKYIEIEKAVKRGEKPMNSFRLPNRKGANSRHSVQFPEGIFKIIEKTVSIDHGHPFTFNVPSLSRSGNTEGLVGAYKEQHEDKPMVLSITKFLSHDVLSKNPGQTSFRESDYTYSLSLRVDPTFFG